MHSIVSFLRAALLPLPDPDVKVLRNRKRRDRVQRSNHQLSLRDFGNNPPVGTGRFCLPDLRAAPPRQTRQVPLILGDIHSTLLPRCDILTPIAHALQGPGEWTQPSAVS